ncbi:MAG TPA: hypothetical protein VGD91_30575 [Trebonia sp.]
METWFHVSSRANRESIRAYGLDWTRMGAAPGIAGSTVPEADGVFLCQDEFHAGFFVRMNNTGGPVDVWVVSGAFQDQMIDNGSGFFYFPGRIPAGQVSLTEWRPSNPRRQVTRHARPRGRRKRHSEPETGDHPGVTNDHPAQPRPAGSHRKAAVSEHLLVTAEASML